MSPAWRWSRARSRRLAGSDAESEASSASADRRAGCSAVSARSCSACQRRVCGSSSRSSEAAMLSQVVPSSGPGATASRAERRSRLATKAVVSSGASTCRLLSAAATGRGRRSPARLQRMRLSGTSESATASRDLRLRRHRSASSRRGAPSGNSASSARSRRCAGSRSRSCAVSWFARVPPSRSEGSPARSRVACSMRSAVVPWASSRRAAASSSGRPSQASLSDSGSAAGSLTCRPGRVRPGRRRRRRSRSRRRRDLRAGRPRGSGFRA